MVSSPMVAETLFRSLCIRTVLKIKLYFLDQLPTKIGLSKWMNKQSSTTVSEVVDYQFVNVTTLLTLLQIPIASHPADMNCVQMPAIIVMII